VFDEVLADALVDAGLGGDEAGGDDDGSFALFAERVDDVLEKEQIWVMILNSLPSLPRP
jgi:hypothetical protein